MPIDDLLDAVLYIRVWNIAKLFACFVFLLYIVFALIVVRQVNLMIKTLAVPIDLPIKTVAWLHLSLAIFAFLLALVML